MMRWTTQLVRVNRRTHSAAVAAAFTCVLDAVCDDEEGVLGDVGRGSGTRKRTDWTVDDGQHPLSHALHFCSWLPHPNQASFFYC